MTVNGTIRAILGRALCGWDELVVRLSVVEVTLVAFIGNTSEGVEPVAVSLPTVTPTAPTRKV
jgi:hypothetical protein